MSHQLITQDSSEPIPTGTSVLRRFLFKYTGVSFIAVVAFLLFRDVSWVRGAAGGVGIMLALITTGVAAWFAIRIRNFKLAMAALVAALPLAFWAWVIYGMVRVNES